MSLPPDGMTWASDREGERDYGEEEDNMGGRTAGKWTCAFCRSGGHNHCQRGWCACPHHYDQPKTPLKLVVDNDVGEAVSPERESNAHNDPPTSPTATAGAVPSQPSPVSPALQEKIMPTPTNDLVIRKAERKSAKLRMALVGPSGSGKTYSALLIAFGLGGKVGMIDTEHGSGELYSNLGEYDVITLEPPYAVSRYVEAMKMFEEAGYSTIILDSISHEWTGEGGLLNAKERLEATGKYRNSFAVWAEITPHHNRFIEEMLNSPCHIIATMRSKTAYVLQADERGKQVPKKVGMEPVQRDQIEFEFTVVFDLTAEHYATASKDRTSLFDGYNEKLSPVTGQILGHWLESGKETAGANPEKGAAGEKIDQPAPAVVIEEEAESVEAEGDGQPETVIEDESQAVPDTLTEEQSKVLAKLISTKYPGKGKVKIQELWDKNFNRWSDISPSQVREFCQKMKVDVPSWVSN